MLRLMMNVLCLDSYSEVLFGDVESTELVLEGLVAPLLENFFEVVIVAGVEITRVPATPAGRILSRVQFEAMCSAQITYESLETVEIKLENALGCALVEFFSSIQMETIQICHTQEVLPKIAFLQRSAC